MEGAVKFDDVWLLCKSVQNISLSVYLFDLVVLHDVLLVQCLNGDLSISDLVFSEVHFSVSAFTNGLEELVVVY